MILTRKQSKDELEIQSYEWVKVKTQNKYNQYLDYK